MAMLGKQGWRLITKPESLCARILKGRYFHDTNFMEATRKKHASQTWRATLAGRDVLQRGLIKRISDGESTNIWRDRWLPKHITGKPITPGDGQELHRVSELMTASGQWNEDLIREIFFPVDAKAILQLPIRPRDGDVWAWEPKRHGIYSVRSAYKLLDKRRRQGEEDQPNTSSDGVWRMIWKLEVPPKVRVFWWRVLHEFLPARQVLCRRHIEPIANCEVCGATEESVKHVSMECTVAKEFWHQVLMMTGVKTYSTSGHMGDRFACRYMLEA